MKITLLRNVSVICCVSVKSVAYSHVANALRNFRQPTIVSSDTTVPRLEREQSGQPIGGVRWRSCDTETLDCESVHQDTESWCDSYDLFDDNCGSSPIETFGASRTDDTVKEKRASKRKSIMKFETMREGTKETARCLFAVEE